MKESSAVQNDTDVKVDVKQAEVYSVDADKNKGLTQLAIGGIVGAVAGTVAVILVGTFVSEESTEKIRANRAVSLFGLLVFIAAFYATSRDRKAIKWQTVITGMLAQFILALFVLRTKAGVSRK